MVVHELVVSWIYPWSYSHIHHCRPKLFVSLLPQQYVVEGLGDYIYLLPHIVKHHCYPTVVTIDQFRRRIC